MLVIPLMASGLPVTFASSISTMGRELLYLLRLANFRIFPGRQHVNDFTRTTAP